MSKVDENVILDAIRTIENDHLDTDLVTLGCVRDLSVEEGVVSFNLKLPAPFLPNLKELKTTCEETVMAIDGVEKVEIEHTWEVNRVPSLQNPGTPTSLEKVRNVIAVASGKGGVGKSTVTVNLAYAFANAGAKVGILDVDIYGPSIPGMLGLRDHYLTSESVQQGSITPVEVYGMKVISMGFLANSDSPVIVRGPIASQMVQQLLAGTAWGELDYLFVDLPPGTGDIQLTLCQAVPLTGGVIVTTPQEVAYSIAEKGLKMFQQVKIPILGIVENMSHYHCPECGHADNIFREGGGEIAAKKLELPLLGKIPLSSEIVNSMEEGVPLIKRSEDSGPSKAYQEIAERVAAQSSVVVMQESMNPESPQEITITDQGYLLVKWMNGEENLIPAIMLRGACPCASCIDEITGEKTLDVESLPHDLMIANYGYIGRYAIRFEFSDGHDTGIFDFTRIRKIGETAGEEMSFDV